MKFILSFICGFLVALIVIAALPKNTEKTSIQKTLERDGISVKETSEEPSGDEESYEINIETPPDNGIPTPVDLSKLNDSYTQKTPTESQIISALKKDGCQVTAYNFGVSKAYLFSWSGKGGDLKLLPGQSLIPGDNGGTRTWIAGKHSLNDLRQIKRDFDNRGPQWKVSPK